MSVEIRARLIQATLEIIKQLDGQLAAQRDALQRLVSEGEGS